MTPIGFQYNCSTRTNPAVRLSPSVLNRALLLDRYLRDDGHRIFFYSPKHVTSTVAELPGYVLDDGEFRPARSRVPRVNGNWTYETRHLLDRAMGFDAFTRWCEERRIGVYVPQTFSELIRDKQATYELVQACRDDLQPASEAYRHSPAQLERFLDAGRRVFVKPRSGSKGNDIATIARARHGLSLHWYGNGRRRRLAAATTRETCERLRELAGGNRRYVIQQGIETLRLGRSVFDLRVLMVHDGERWSWLHEARTGRAGNDLSNVSQGGRSVVTEDLLFNLLGHAGAQAMLTRLRDEAFGLAAWVERLHPGDIMELAFDFVVDRDQRLRLIEINTKPGLASVGFLRRLTDSRPADAEAFRRYVEPHLRAVAGFLVTKQRQQEH